MADDSTAKVVKMRGRGRPAFEPSEFQRGQINAMVVCGIPVEEISRALGISEKTLVKFYREELLIARTKAHVEMGAFIYNTALGRGDPDRRLTDERSRATMAIFYAKTQMKWRETSIHLHGEAPPDTDAALEALTRGLDRIAARKGEEAAIAASDGGAEGSAEMRVEAVGKAGATIASG
jgi:hypothetical protein